jgi:RNA polymerase sigma-54 factor
MYNRDKELLIGGNKMELGFGLIQQQQLKLVMTPELRQSITILQYSAIDLIGFLREQANDNPLLELEEPEIIKRDERSSSNVNKDGWEESESGSYLDFTITKEDYINPIDYYVDDHQMTLQKYVLEQIQFLHLSHSEEKLLHFLIGNLDENGYLEATFEMLPANLSLSLEEWEQGVTILQQLEPYGIGARSLEECLLIQLRHMEWQDALCEQVIRFHLADLAANRYQKMATKLKVKVDEIQQVADFIKGLQPKPGVLFHAQECKYIIPDVFVEQIGEGQFIVQVNDRIIPRIHLNKEYKDLMKEKEEAKSFLEQRLVQLNWLVKSLEQRKRTILRVTEAIIEAQKEFFEQGESFLKPLTLKEVAQKVQVHESTVSRATNQKYVQTPRGVFELKYFFANRLSSSNGENTSTDYVKQLVKQIVEGEEKAKPYSDQKIVQLLKENDVDIARRTVAKYRDELGILSSTQRKRYDQADR